MSTQTPVPQMDNFKHAMCLLDDLAMELEMPDQTYITLANALKDGREAIIDTNLPQVAKPVFRNIIVHKRRGEVCGLVVATTYHGLVITHVRSPECVAEGFKPGDVIHAVNGNTMTSAVQVAHELRRRSGRVNVTVQRIEYEPVEEDNTRFSVTMIQNDNEPHRNDQANNRYFRRARRILNSIVRSID